MAVSGGEKREQIKVSYTVVSEGMNGLCADRQSLVTIRRSVEVSLQMNAGHFLSVSVE